MGWWKSEHGIIGDWPADILQKALRDIEDVYLTDAGRLPSQGELADLIEFSTCGVFRPQCGDPRYPCSQATCGDKKTPRAAERGSQGAIGDASRKSRESSGGMFNVDPSTGEHWKQPRWDEIQRGIERLEDDENNPDPECV